MSSLEKLRSATTLSDLAPLLKVSRSGLAYLMYIARPETQYQSFEIPKRGGGVRRIDAPTEKLAYLQRKLADLLSECALEIKGDILLGRASHGFRKERSIWTNAKIHRKHRHVFNIDLADFFPSIAARRVYGFFRKNRVFQLHPKIATLLTNIACVNGALPQGSPCSPIISNFIAHILDVHLGKLAARAGCAYSRYADDLSFSTNLESFPSQIAVRSAEEGHEWLPSPTLDTLVQRSGFRIKEEKTRMQYRSTRQEVTGLVVNSRVNVRSEYRRTVRAMVHSYLRGGSFHIQCLVKQSDGSHIMEKKDGAVNQLRGMLGFIETIDRRHRDDLALSGANKPQPLNIETMHREFLMFTEFHLAKSPLILCEGPTDGMYIRHAIKRLAIDYPLLASSTKSGGSELSVRFYKYRGRSTDRLLGLTGGTPCLTSFLNQYKKNHYKFRVAGDENPTIVVVDRDPAGQAVARSVKAVKAKATDPDPLFFHLFGSTYLIILPIRPGLDTTVIENLFHPKLLETPFEGRTFTFEEDYDLKTQFGKKELAKKVVPHLADPAEFEYFKPLLNSISAVLEHHGARLLTPGKLSE